MAIDSLPVSVTCVTDRQQRKTSNMARVNLHKFPLIHSSGLVNYRAVVKSCYRDFKLGDKYFGI